MGNSNKRLIILALLLALATAGCVYVYLNKIRTDLTLGKTQTVMVAAQNIPAKAVITAEMLKQVSVHTEYIHPQAILTAKDAIGAITSAPVVQGEQLLKDRVVRKDDNSYLAFKVPEGRRAISVNVTEAIGVGFMVQPGDTVDVLATINPDQPNKLMTRTILQDIAVLAVSQEREATGEDKTKLAKTYTLAVSPDQAEALTLAEEKGRIRFTLRNVTDHGIAGTPGLNLDGMMARNR
ncbi:MAG: Flp pilus assembly protein CpaB [Bacillota bacterium]